MQWAVLGWVGWRLFGPELPPRFPGIQERPTRITGRTVLVGQRELFVREAGGEESPPLVLLHGWGYDSLATWHRVIEPLAERYRVIAIDQRNHGRSDHIRGEFDIDDVADEVAGVMDAIGVASASVLGYSMGGMVAQALAHRHPAKVKRLILGATAAHPIAERRLATAIFFGMARGVVRFSIIGWARATHRYMLSHGAVEPKHSRWLWETLLDRDPTLSFESGAAVWHFDSRTWVRRILQPALVIIPEADQLIGVESQRELAGLLKEASVVEIPGARHEAIMTHPDDFVKAIEAYLG